MDTPALDSDQCYRAFLQRDPQADRRFVAAVRTTGIFCRPSCPARKPKRENVEFYPTPARALEAGYRPCYRCRPMEGGEFPPELVPLFHAIDDDPSRRWTEQDLADFGVDPKRVRQWFLQTHGMTLLAYLRHRRLGAAFSRIEDGIPIAESALESGFESISGFCEAVRRSTGLPPKRLAQVAPLYAEAIDTPLGPLWAAADQSHLYLCEFWDRRNLKKQFETLGRLTRRPAFPGSSPLLLDLKAQLDDYFNGLRRAFTLPWNCPGTAHQEAVWKAIESIPYGQTLSYEELAGEIGKNGGTRAVANAVGDNRMAILVPCHRIVSKSGKITGYGGGIWRKNYLLHLESTSSKTS